jgi:hypothetical protein
LFEGMDIGEEGGVHHQDAPLKHPG